MACAASALMAPLPTLSSPPAFSSAGLSPLNTCPLTGGKANPAAPAESLFTVLGVRYEQRHLGWVRHDHDRARHTDQQVVSYRAE